MWGLMLAFGAGFFFGRNRGASQVVAQAGQQVVQAGANLVDDVRMIPMSTPCPKGQVLWQSEAGSGCVSEAEYKQRMDQSGGREGLSL